MMRLALPLLVVTAAAGCGGQVDDSSEVRSQSGVPVKPVNQLTDSERLRLCEWATPLSGGYGYRYNCPDPQPDLFWFDTAGDCVKLLEKLTCQATVYENCATAFHEARQRGEQCTVLGTDPACIARSKCP